MTSQDRPLVDQLISKGVIVHRPDSSIIEDLDPERIEAGVVIYPGTILRGQKSLVGAGSQLGRVGGGSFENAAIGRDCRLDGGDYRDCVVRDGVHIRAGAELRRGSLLEEGCRAGRQSGFKMSVLMPYVTAGSLVDFADALVTGGSGPDDFSEIGSSLALYNYTPQGDKFASLFGSVPEGVFLDRPRIFIGGQTQIISPVRVGFGAVIAAGGAVRRDVAAGRLYAERSPDFDEPFVQGRYGALAPKLTRTGEYIGNLKALELWYQRVRLPLSQGDTFVTALNLASLAQLRAGTMERIQRLDRLIGQLPRSIVLHQQRSMDADADEIYHRRRIKEHRHVMQAWPELREQLMHHGSDEATAALDSVTKRARALGLDGISKDQSFPVELRDQIDLQTKTKATLALETWVEAHGACFDSAAERGPATG